MASAREELAKWRDAVMTAPPDAEFEVGTTWSPTGGWRVYQRIGDHFLLFSPRVARELHKIYSTMGVEAQHRQAYDDLKPMIEELARAADEVERKNRDGVVPDQALAVIPGGGHA